MKKITIIIMCLLLIVLFLSACSPSDRELYDEAIRTNNINLCRQMEGEHFPGGGEQPWGKRRCIEQIAINTGNDFLCEEAWRGDMKEYYYKPECYKKVNGE